MANQTPVQHVLAICQANAEEIAVLEQRERLDDLNDYAEMTATDVSHLASKLEKRRVADGRVILPQKLVKNIQALCFWCSERVRRSEPLDHAAFTPLVLDQAKREMRMRTEEKAEPPSIKPDKFKPAKWKTWSKQFDLYLSNYKGAQFAPLDYVIRKEPLPMGHVHANDRERALYEYPLRGPHFQEDNMTVFRMLNDLVSGTEGDAWIADFTRAQNGREAWRSLSHHYEGGGNERKKITEAEATIDALHYKNESIFSFESFSTKLIESYRDLRDTECEKSNYEQVKLLLDKIQIVSAQVEIHKAYVRQNFRADLTGAVTYLSTEFARMFPQATFHTGRRGGRTVSASEPATTRQRTGDYRYGQNEQPKREGGVITFLGIDVTNVGRTFSPQEMTALGGSGQRYVFTERDRLGLSRNRSNRGRPGRGRGDGRDDGRGRGSRRIQAITTGNPPEDMSAITQVTHSSQPEPPQEDESIQPPATQHTVSNEPSDSSTRGSANGMKFGAGGYRQ